jgi:hypothetical protein
MWKSGVGGYHFRQTPHPRMIVQPEWPRSLPTAAMPHVDERDVGMCEYACPSIASIGGELKRSASDFCVNELDTDGAEVTLNDADASADSSEVGDEVDEPSFVRFVLHKERMDTLVAINELSKQLGVPVRAFGIAGLKDHKAVTAQEVTVRGVTPKAVRAVSHPHFRIGRLRCADNPLNLGQLGGNRFRIALRGVHGDVAAALDALKKRGFINYYGQQRFGDCAARVTPDGLGPHARAAPPPPPLLSPPCDARALPCAHRTTRWAAGCCWASTRRRWTRCSARWRRTRSPARAP